MVFKRTPVGLFMFSPAGENLVLVAGEDGHMIMSAQDAEDFYSALPGGQVLI